MAMTSQEKRDGSLDAERAVIGAMLIEPDIVRDVVGKVSAEDFLHPTNRLIFQAARALFRAGEPVDAITIRGRIGQQYRGGAKTAGKAGFAGAESLAKGRGGQMSTISSGHLSTRDRDRERDRKRERARVRYGTTRPRRLWPV